MDCQANTKENKCFFASGTSALQIFRIGRTIATRVSPGQLDTKKICILFLFFAISTQTIIQIMQKDIHGNFFHDMITITTFL